MASRQEVVIVIDERAIRVPYRVWNLGFVVCAGEMIQDGDHYDRYKGAETKKDLDAVAKLYNSV